MNPKKPSDKLFKKPVDPPPKDSEGKVYRFEPFDPEKFKKDIKKFNDLPDWMLDY